MYRNPRRTCTPFLLLLTFIALAPVSTSAAERRWSFESLSLRPASGSELPLFYPIGLAVDALGDLYVADAANHAIRKISPSGELTTLAGLPGRSGTADGYGPDARFHDPSAVAVDLDGTIYVSDTANCIIRRIAPDGLVTTVAGSPGRAGLVDGVGAAARFGYIEGIALDSAGNIYVADTSNHAIRRVSPAGEVTTLAGNGSVGFADGAASRSRFTAPRGVAIDRGGNLWIADTGNHVIRMLSPDGFVSTVAGVPRVPGTVDGPADQALFNGPAAISFGPDGSLFVADYRSFVIRSIDVAGQVTTIGGSAGQRGATDGIGAAALFDSPLGLASDLAGRLYVGDMVPGTIRSGRELSESSVVEGRRRGVRR